MLLEELALGMPALLELGIPAPALGSIRVEVLELPGLTLLLGLRVPLELPVAVPDPVLLELVWAKARGLKHNARALTAAAVEEINVIFIRKFLSERFWMLGAPSGFSPNRQRVGAIPRKALGSITGC